MERKCIPSGSCDETANRENDFLDVSAERHHEAARPTSKRTNSQADRRPNQPDPTANRELYRRSELKHLTEEEKLL